MDAPAYREAWREERGSIRVGATLVVGPPGTRAAAAPGDRVIELAFPGSRAATGVAFGTGEHATTRLALGLLEERLQRGDRVLDVGAGSGILALAAALLGAREVVAVENDPPAARTAVANVRLNRMAAIVRVHEGELNALDEAPFDLVVANILTPVIRELTPRMRRLLRPDGPLILSGIIAVEAEEVRETLALAGFRLTDERGEGDWRALALR